MKRFEYIGPKADGERAFKAQTGEWFPGDVREVSDEHARLLLAHPTSWREVAQKPVALAEAHAAPAAAPAMSPANQDASSLPAWVRRGVDLGATDDQLEAIAQAGGPETEQGAALWRDATGTDADTEDGLASAAGADPLAGIDTMEADELHALAKKLGVKVHHMTGAVKLREALRAAK